MKKTVGGERSGVENCLMPSRKKCHRTIDFREEKNRISNKRFMGEKAILTAHREVAHLP